MGYTQRQKDVRQYRGQLPSPGRPTVAWRADRVRFWSAIADVKTEDACVGAGVSGPLGFRWFRRAGGVNPCLACEVSGRHLSFREREDIAIWHAQQVSAREIARRLAVTRQRSRVSCVVTRPPGPIGWFTGRRSRSGMPSGGLVDRRRRS
jgi:hypothetical protein